MASKEGKYNVKAISKMLGIQPGTLRAWERRYQIIEPVRNEAGHRLYSEEHVKIIQWLLQKVEKGFTIGQAVQLLQDEDIPFTFKENNTARQLQKQLLSALCLFNERKANELISEAFTLYHVNKVVLDLFYDLIVEMDKQIQNKEMNEAHEQFIFTFLKTKLSSIFQNSQLSETQHKIITVSCQDGTDEFGMLTYSLFLRRSNYNVTYFGVLRSVSLIKEAVISTKADRLILSCTDMRHIDKIRIKIKELNELLPNVKIGVLSYPNRQENKEFKKHFKEYYIGSTTGEWEKWLEK